VVAGADGISSTGRELTFGTPPPEYLGGMVWRSLTPERPRNLSEVRILLGNHRFHGLMPMGDGHTYCFGFLATPLHRDPVEGRLQRVRQTFAEVGAPVSVYLNFLESDAWLHCAPIEWAEPNHWFSGRVVLIGDTAHASPPSMTQGGTVVRDRSPGIESTHSGDFLLPPGSAVHSMEKHFCG
jgi:2-polyprenyl-6-methoxyphenol hydroxylase-like FAD-dependent oxidoreductase